MTSLLELGITSQQQADELERDLGVRFDDFTPEDCETWFRQTDYLDQFSRTRAVSFAADHAGVTIRTARQWQVENTLGFNNRLELAVLRYTDALEVMLLRHAQEPKASPYLLMMLARAHMPEKYGSARRNGPPRDDNPTTHHCDHDPQPANTSQYDRELMEEVFRDLQNLKQFTGLTEPSDLSLTRGETQRGGAPTPADQPPVGAGFKPAHDLEDQEEDPTHLNLSPTAEENTPHSDLSPAEGETPRGGAPTPADQTPVGAGFKPAHDLEDQEEDTTHLNLSAAGGETQRGGAPTPADQTPVGAGFKPAHDLEDQEEDTTHLNLSPTGGETQRGGAPTPQHPAPNTQNPEPPLNRQQRRELQRRAKRQKSHLARAPN